MIVQTTAIAIENSGWKTYIIFAVLNSSFVPVIFLFFPETKGLELEDVDRLFAADGIIVDNVPKEKVCAVATVDNLYQGHTP